MFERNRVDNSLKQSAIPVELTLTDGSVLKGQFHLSASRTLADIINGPVAFLDFETFSGERALLAKSSFARIKMMDPPKAARLPTDASTVSGFDPYAVLGVSRDTSWDDIRAAFLKLSKIYHPDRYQGVTLPSEVQAYLAAMARRINIAFHALEAPVIAARQTRVEKAKPIFSSPVRA